MDKDKAHDLMDEKAVACIEALEEVLGEHPTYMLTLVDRYDDGTAYCNKICGLSAFEIGEAVKTLLDQADEEFDNNELRAHILARLLAPLMPPASGKGEENG